MTSHSSTVVCLIRHGETDWNATGRLQGCEDIELNEAGRRQTLQLVSYLQSRKWDLIISSPLKRAFESASILASELSLPDPLVIDELRERNYGEASGLLPEERRKRFPDGVYPGQEEFEQLRTRAMNALLNITRKYSGKHLIVVSHGAFINSILYTLSNGEFGSFKTRLKNGCLSMLTRSGDDWTVNFYNKTAEELS